MSSQSKYFIIGYRYFILTFRIIGLLSKDALEDFAVDNPSFETLDTKDQKIVKSSMGTVVSKLVLQNAAEIVSGEY